MFTAPNPSTHPTAAQASASHLVSAGASATRYHGPDRRAVQPTSPHWLAIIDEIDYGMLLLDAHARALHVNHAARTELDGLHPLQLHGSALRGRTSQDEQALVEALRCARRGLRKLLVLGAGKARISVSVVPLRDNQVDGEAVTLLMLGKRQVSEDLSLQGYARSVGLTPTEGRVLAALCRGTPPGAIAAQSGVAISTVRSHISTIRQKTAAPSIRALVQQVAVLPPLMGVLRGLGSRRGDDDGRAFGAA